MKLILLLQTSLLLPFALSAQMVLTDPVTGKTFDTEKYSATNGTPFLVDKWLPGNATSARGVYKNIQLKLDLYENVLYFNKDEAPYEFQEQIKSFVVFDRDSLYFKKGLTGNALKPEQYVRVLASGKINFYRSDIKVISEMSEINAGMVKTFNTATRYYIEKDGKVELVKLNKGDILEFLKDQKDKIKEFMDANSTKKEADFERIIQFYNRL